MARSFDAYAAAKARVFALQGAADVHVGNLDDEASAAISRSAPCEVRWFTIGEPARTGRASVTPPGRRGAARISVRSRSIRRRCAPMRRLPPPRPTRLRSATARSRRRSGPSCRNLHRGEPVATVDGVRFVDNSKATNPHATIAAVWDAEGVVLIAGGDAKGVDLTPLGSVASRLAGVVAIGASAGDVRSVFEGQVPVRDAGSIEEATRVAFRMASGRGTVLLAPACASWDMFRDYAERGDRFDAAARALEKEEART